MELIPVIDLKGDAVVHARRGARNTYRPLSTPLCNGSAPLDVVDGLLGLGGFRTLYVADLDAIAGLPGHGRVLADIVRRHPALVLWVDAGESHPGELTKRRAQGPGRPVLGSESLSGMEAAKAALAAASGPLSLDYGPEGPRGPAMLHRQAELWPDEVIVMTLARVGAGEGPDFARLEDVLARAGRRRVYAAGGVRNGQDLQRLAAMGVAGVLVATALHDGRLSAADIETFTR